MDVADQLKTFVVYGVGAAIVCDWKKKRNQIEDFCAKMFSNNSLEKRVTNESLDNTPFIWFKQEDECVKPMSWAILKSLCINI